MSTMMGSSAAPVGGGSSNAAAVVAALLLLSLVSYPRAADAAAFSSCSSFPPGHPAGVLIAPKAKASSTRLWTSPSSSSDEAGGGDTSSYPPLRDRRSFVLNSAAMAAAVMGSSHPDPAFALVKGNAPPPKKARGEGDSEGGERKKCRNVEECQEMAERLAAEEDARMRASATPLSTAPGGSRYRDLVEGGGNGDGVKPGDLATVRYRVLKLGKRSYDGVSGEGTVVFSRGYGLEDDEPKPGVTSFRFRVGDPNVIAALSDGIQSMKVGGTRRIGVLPQMGWERATKMCDGGPGGGGAGGDLKTDYVIVPTATMVATESCFDKTKLPFPTTYAEERRMAQRFDQSLIIEVELVDVS